jgi:hypothetical protein
LKKLLVVVVQACHTSYCTGNINRRIVIQDSPSIKLDPISKITNTKKAGGVV